MPVKIGKGRFNTIIAMYPPDAQMVCRNQYILTQSGNYGWRNVYYYEGQPIIVVVVDNAHAYSAVYDVRTSPEQIGACV